MGIEFYENHGTENVLKRILRLSAAYTNVPSVGDSVYLSLKTYLTC